MVVHADGQACVEVLLRGVGGHCDDRESPHGPWRISRSPALSIAMPDAFFVALGLPLLTVR